MLRLLLVALLLATPARADLSESAPNITGATDGTKIGNVADRFKVDAALAASSVSTANSTAVTLGAAGVFTGTFEEILNYAEVAISLKVTQEGTLVVQWSSDGTNIDDTDTYNIGATGTSTSYTFGSNFRYVKVVYTNGATPQTTFRMQTIFRRTQGKPSSHRIEDAIDGEKDAELVKSVLTVRSPDGDYLNVPGDDNGNLVITAITGFGADFVFGDVATAATATVAVRRTAYTEQTTNAQRSFASSDVDDGSPVDTGARTINIEYLDQTGAGPFEETLTLNGTTCVATVASDIAFIEHINVVTAGSTGANEGTITMYVNAACGGGTIGTVSAGTNQSLWAHHYVPSDKSINVTGISVGSTATTVGCGALFVLKAKDLAVSDSADIQLSDFVRLYGQSSTTTRTYGSPIKLDGPARLVLYVTPECSTSLTYRAAMDFFQP
jgi:hypothetical protein